VYFNDDGDGDGDSDGDGDGRYGDNSNSNSNSSRSKCRCNNNNNDNNNNNTIDVLIPHGPPLGMCGFIPDDVDDGLDRMKQQQGTTGTSTGTLHSRDAMIDLFTTIQQRVQPKI